MMTHLPAELRDEILLHLAEEQRTGKRRHDRGLPCIWYDAETRRCGQYEHRPGACRKFEIASDGCNQWRAGLGLAPFEIERPSPADGEAPDSECSARRGASRPHRAHPTDGETTL
jgi:Fe-S-cluster containining protein